MAEVGPEDRRSVRPFQVVVFCGYIAAGLQAALLGAPPGAVAHAMGNTVAWVWIVMLVACPSVSLAGLALQRWVVAPWLQLSGNLGVAAASAAYVVAVLQATWADRASLAAWVIASLAGCAVGLAVGDVRWIVVVARQIRKGGRGD